MEDGGGGGYAVGGNHLEDDLPLQLVGRGQGLRGGVDRGGEELVSEHFDERRRHVALLGQRAVVLNRQDQWEPEGGVALRFRPIPSGQQ